MFVERLLVVDSFVVGMLKNPAQKFVRSQVGIVSRLSCTLPESTDGVGGFVELLTDIQQSFVAKK